MIVVAGGAGFIGSNIIAELKNIKISLLLIGWDVAISGKILLRELAAIITPEHSHHNEMQAIIHMGAVSITTEKDAYHIIQSNFQLS